MYLKTKKEKSILKNNELPINKYNFGKEKTNIDIDWWMNCKRTPRQP